MFSVHAFPFSSHSTLMLPDDSIHLARDGGKTAGEIKFIYKTIVKLILKAP